MRPSRGYAGRFDADNLGVHLSSLAAEEASATSELESSRPALASRSIVGIAVGLEQVQTELFAAS